MNIFYIIFIVSGIHKFLWSRKQCSIDYTYEKIRGYGRLNAAREGLIREGICFWREVYGKDLGEDPLKFLGLFCWRRFSHHSG